MTKFFGWAIILITGTVLLILSSSIITVAIMSRGFQHFQTKDILPVLLGVAIPFGIFTLGFIKGLKMVRKPKAWIQPPSVENMNIAFTSTISLKEYRAMIFENAFKKRFLITGGAIILLMVIGLINKNEKDWETMKLYAFGLMIVFMIVPFLIFIQAKKLYSSNKVLHEKIFYTIDNEKIIIKGESFNSECNWNHFLKVKETKGFFMIFEGATTAMLINKEALDQEQTINLRALLLSKLPTS
jgi:hypothetical protein